MQKTGIKEQTDDGFFAAKLERKHLMNDKDICLTVHMSFCSK